VETEKGRRVVMEDGHGTRIELRCVPGQEDSLSVLTRLPEKGLMKDQVLFGLIYYDREDHSMCMSPLSIVTRQGIVRLMY